MSVSRDLMLFVEARHRIVTSPLACAGGTFCRTHVTTHVAFELGFWSKIWFPLWSRSLKCNLQKPRRFLEFWFLWFSPRLFPQSSPFNQRVCSAKLSSIWNDTWKAVTSSASPTLALLCVTAFEVGLQAETLKSQLSLLSLSRARSGFLSLLFFVLL